VRTANFSARKCGGWCEEKFGVGFRGGFSLFFLFAAEKERKIRVTITFLFFLFLHH
jgi:hypothetical protein